MENGAINLFVYGSLRRIFQVPAFEYIRNHFSFLGEAKVKGLLYAADYPAAIKTSAEVFITGELYELRNNHDFDVAIKELDAYEEANEEAGQFPVYRREL